MNVMFSSTAAVGTKGAVSGSTNGTNAVTGGDAFGQALVQALGGMAVQDGQTGTLMLQGNLNNPLLGNLQEGGLLEQLIAQFMAQLQQTDGELEHNEPLLQQLQDWLKQADELLAAMMAPQGNMMEAAVGAEEQESLDLASHPQTLRFAVQDKLMQLLSLVNGNGMDTNNAVAEQQTKMAAVSMLQLLQETGKNSPAGSPHAKLDDANASNSALIQRLQALLNDTGAANLANNTQNAVPTHTEQLAQMLKSLQTILNQVGKTAGAATQKMPIDVSSEAMTQDDKAEELPQTFTAGQMALRTHEAPVMKAAPQVIHAQQFATEMSNFVVKQMDFVKLHGVSEAKITLFPEHLGQVDIRITVQNGNLVAQFMTEHAMAKDVLENQMVQLRSALQAQGLQVEKLEVSQNQSLSSQMFQEQRQPNSGQRGSEQQNKNRVSAVEDGSNAGFGEELEGEEQKNVNEVGYGSSFTATA